MKRLSTLFCILFLTLLPPLFCSAITFPSPTGYVTDTTSLLTPEQKNTLEQKLENYEKETKTEIALLITDTTSPLEISQYATQIGNEWGVGKSNADNGIMIVTAMSDRKFWIATGNQTGGALTDAKSGSIYRNYIKPHFKEGNYYTGLSKGIDAIIAELAGEVFTGSTAPAPEGDSFSFFGIFFGIITGLIWLGSVLGRSKAIWPGAVIGGLGGFFLGLILALGLFELISLTAVLSILGLGFDALVSGEYQSAKSSGRSPRWWAGGGGFSGGSSSGGGFSGFGGGGFSGGGGGGSW